MHFENIVVDNLNINYVWTGKQNANFKILVLHGWNQHGSKSWLNFLSKNNPESENAADSDLFIIAIDLPCFGKSDCPESVWNTEDYANFVVKIINALQIKFTFNNPNWNLVGHSFGGAIATLVTNSMEENNYLNDSPLHGAPVGIKPQGKALDPKIIFLDPDAGRQGISTDNNQISVPKLKIDHLILVAPAIIRHKSSLKQRLIKNITKSLKLLNLIPFFGKMKPIATKIWYKVIGSPDYNLTTGIKRQIMQLVLQDDLRGHLSNIKTKNLLIWGTKDKYTPFNDFKLVSNLLSLNTGIVYNNFGHGIHLQDPDKLYSDVLNFVSNKD